MDLGIPFDKRSFTSLFESDLINFLYEIQKLSIRTGEYVIFKFSPTDQSSGWVWCQEAMFSEQDSEGKKLKINLVLFKKFRNICDILSVPHKEIIEIDIPESISYRTCCFIINSNLPHDIDGYLDLIFAGNFLGYEELLKLLYLKIFQLLTFEEMVKLRILYFGLYTQEEYMKLAYYYKDHNLDEKFNLLTQLYNNPWENSIDKKFHKLEADNVKNILLLSLNPIYEPSPCKTIKYARICLDENYGKGYYHCGHITIPISFMEGKIDIKTEFDLLNDKFREITKLCCYKTLPNIYILYYNMTCLYYYAHQHNLYYAPLYDKDFTDYEKTKKIYIDSIEEVEEIKPYFEPLDNISYHIKRIDPQDIRSSYYLSSRCPSYGAFLSNGNIIDVTPNNILVIKMNSFFLNRKTDTEIQELSHAKSIHYVNYNREKLIDCLARIINPVTF